MEKQFINQSNLTYLNNNLSQRINLQSKSNEDKKECVQILLNNMRNVYSKLDSSKITSNNINKIMQSFFKYSLEMSIKEINSKYEQPTKSSNSKYTRDKEINNNRKVNYIERPGFDSSNNSNSSYSNFDTSQRNQDYTQSINRNLSSVDNLENIRSGHSSRSNTNDAPEKSYEKLVKSRNLEMNKANQRPSTPDFSLDGSGAKQKKNNLENIENFDNVKVTDRSENKNSFLSRETETINIDGNRMEGDTYHLVGSNLDSNFGNVNFGNNELSHNLPDIDESMNVNDRLKMLQSERSSFDTNNNEDQNQNQNQNQNQYQNQNQNQNQNSYLNQRNNQTNPDYQKRQEEMEQQEQRRKIMEMQRQEEMKNNYSKQQQNQQEHYSNNIENNIPNQQLYDMINNMYQTIPKEASPPRNNNSPPRRKESPPRRKASPPRRESSPPKVDNSNKSEFNQYLNELNKKQLEQLKQIQDLQEQMQRQLQNQNYNSNNNMGNGNDRVKEELISKVKILTGELEQYKRANTELKSNLDEALKNKENESEKKMKLIEQKKVEIKEEIIRLSNKHNDLEDTYKKLVKTEKKVKNLIKKNSNILNIEKKTYLIDSKQYNNQSKYNFSFNEELKNIKRIELISYDFPIISNNINSMNNKFYFKINSIKSIDQDSKQESDSEERCTGDEDEVIEMMIPHGNYDISSLIKKINKLCRSYKISMSYNKNTSKVTIKSDNEENVIIFNKESSVLKILGFTELEYNNESKYVSNNSYDLRKNKYVKIKINNLDDQNFADVFIQPGKINSYYKDFDPIICSLENLDIEMQDNNGNLIDFCNLKHRIEFLITYSNDEKTDLSYFQNNLIDNDNDDNNIQINSDDIESDDRIIFNANNNSSEQDPDALIDALKGKLNQLSYQ